MAHSNVGVLILPVNFFNSHVPGPHWTPHESDTHLLSQKLTPGVGRRELDRRRVLGRAWTSRARGSEYGWLQKA